MSSALLRDKVLIDALEEAPRTKFSGSVFRITRSGRDPLLGSTPRGRWDDGSFDVLYTSENQDGACAEIYFHLKSGQPIFPTNLSVKLYEIKATLNASLELLDMSKLKSLGVDTDRYGSLEYSRRTEEYSRTQQIGEAAYFLEFDGLIVPNARWKCNNIIIFTNRITADALNIMKDYGNTDLLKWAKKNST